jgi:hypothetical protein
MSDDQGSGFEWRRKRGWLNKTLEKVEDLPYNVASRSGAITDSAKRKLYEEGIAGQAQILKAPSEKATSKVNENIGRFRVRVDIPGRDSYEVTITQSFEGGYESAGLKEGALVECRVDPNERPSCCCSRLRRTSAGSPRSTPPPSSRRGSVRRRGSRKRTSSR